MDYLQKLATMARAGDWGTSQQIAAENDFFDTLDLYLAGKLTEEEQNAFAAYCHRATSDERIDEGLRLAVIAAAR